MRSVAQWGMQGLVRVSMQRRARWSAAALLGLSACSGGGAREATSGPGLGEGGLEETGDPGTGDTSAGATTDPVDPDTSLSGADGSSGDPAPPAQSCSYTSTSYGQGMQELDVPTGSTEVLSFTVLGVPDPALIDAATLHFASHDADHPGEEGVVWVNGQGPYELPADTSWDNVDSNGSIDVTGALVEGLNVIEFGAGSLEPRSFYRIGDGTAFAGEIDFWDATYGMRHNWVLRCDGFEYAFTAYGAEHLTSDCDGLYDPDGTRRGTATFVFDDVVDATYEIQIRSRHTVNRNPLGALFVVNGEGIRIDQRDDADFTTDVWGVRPLSGQVTVVLDSSQESESDSVIWVRLEPVAG